MFLINLITSDMDISEILMMGVAFIIIMFLSIVVHEWAHAFAALKCGDDTAKLNGRLTLNPMAHFEPRGMIMMLLIGFGWAKPVPINPSNFKNLKGGMVAVSLAGVTTNIIMALFWLLLLFLAGGPLAPHMLTGNQVVRVLSLLAFNLIVFGVFFNFMLAFFNLLPIFPLDGFNLVNTFLPHGNAFTAFMRRYGMIVLFVLIALGLLGDLINVPWLNVFGMFSNLIFNLINRVLGASLYTFVIG